MAITVSIASDTSMPINQENLPVTVTLTPTATDSTDASPSMAFSYFMVSKPTGSSATFSQTIGASTSLDIDVWGNYQVFVIATNSNNSLTSETNPVGAPIGSFFTIKVQSEKKRLQKPAPTERNWQTPYHDLVTAVEDLKADRATLTVEGSSEIANVVEIATGAGALDSNTGAELVITPDRLGTVLGSDNAGGAITGGTVNSLRNQIKDIGDERIAAASVGDLSNVDITSAAPTNGQVLAWDGTNFVPADNGQDGDITGVTAGDYLTGGGTSGDVTLNVADIDVDAFAANSIQLSSEAFSDNDTSIMTSAAINDLIQANAGSSSTGDQYDIQVADGSGGFTAANWQITAGDDLIPVTDNSFDIGTSTKRVRKIYAYDAQFYDDVTVSDLLRVNGDQQFIGVSYWNDYASIQDITDDGSLRIFAGGSGGGGSGTLELNTDEVVIDASSSATHAKLSLKTSSDAKLTISTQDKATSNYTLLLPDHNAEVGDVMKVTSTGPVALDFAKPDDFIHYTTHVSREVDNALTFTLGQADAYADNSQAALYWFKNTTGSVLKLVTTHIHIGHMTNVNLGVSLCKATSDTDAINNDWTQVGSAVTLVNSSGSDNVLGQAQTTITDTTTLNNGDYLGLVCTNIPAANRTDKRISITFSCIKNGTYDNGPT